ncbi:MAG: hypothetical protein HND48_19000 [Chloroflexi bacterium]|nr:hypothetical protein [Chloroflexota bacterium]
MGGTLILGVRASGEGSYEASISSSGQVELRRGGQVIGHTSTSAVQTGKSIRIALRAAGADIAVDIDGTTVLTAADPDPLPPGTTYLGSGHASAGQIHVDDVLLAGVRIVVDDNPGEITVIHTDGLSMRSGSPVVAFNAGGQLLTLDSPADQPVVRWGTSIIGHAAWSPDGSKIALTSNDNGDYDIALFDISTGALTIYPRAGTGDSMPAWSPDGSQIVFVSTSTSSCQMMRLTLSTITFQSLFSGQAFSHPSYSPDSTQVTYGVYVLGYPNNGTILQRRTLSTGQTDGPASAFFADDPEWSPDGSRIAFHVHVEDGGSTVPGGIGLWSLADDSIETRTAQIGDASPTWMSGDELMFVRAGDLYTLNVSPACPAEVPQLYFDAPYTVEFPDWNGTTAAIRTCPTTPEEEYLRSSEGVVFWSSLQRDE